MVDVLVDALSPVEAKAMLNKLVAGLARKASGVADAPATTALPRPQPVVDQPDQYTEKTVIAAATDNMPAVPTKAGVGPRNLSPDYAARLAADRQAIREAAMSTKSTRESMHQAQLQLDTDAPPPRPAAAIPQLTPAQMVKQAEEATAPKIKSMAEATGTAARSDERQHAALAKTGGTKTLLYEIVPDVTGSTKPSVGLADFSALCPDILREVQPAGFNPYELLRSRVNQFCQDTNNKLGPSILSRFKFSVVDHPMVNVADARYVGFKPIMVAGRCLDGSATKLILGYIQPSQASFDQVWQYLHQVLQLWNDGREFDVGTAPSAVKRSLGDPRISTGDRPGMNVRPVADGYRHRPTVYIFRPFDFTTQVSVIIA